MSRRPVGERFELVIRGEVRALRVGDGEAIVVQLAHEPGPEEARSIQAMFEEKLGAPVVVIVHGPNSKIGKIELMP